jgi:putative Mn2+ efflux pump MntP
MPTQRRMRFVHGQCGWMLATVLVLVSIDALTYELFFILALIGLLTITVVTAPFAVAPLWRRRLRWIVAVGGGVFIVIVVYRLVKIVSPVVGVVSPGVFPW